MSDRPVFSIIIPVYNEEKYISECLESIVNQKFNFWEAIIVDDGSTDESINICKMYAMRDPRIRILSQKRMGSLAARRLGIDNAEGDYYIEVNADDYISLNALEVIKDSIDKSGCDIVAWSIKCFGDDDGGIVNILKTDAKYNVDKYICSIIESSNHSLCNKAIPVRYLKNIDHSKLPMTIRMADDYALVIPSLLKGKQVYVISDELYFYRRVGDSITHENSLDVVRDAVIVSAYVMELLETSNIITAELYAHEAYKVLGIIFEKVWGAICTQNFDDEVAKEIHNIEYYRKIARYEAINDLHWFHYIILKLFRGKCYIVLKAIAKVKNVVKECRK